jgi:hypothetical protein
VVDPWYVLVCHLKEVAQASVEQQWTECSEFWHLYTASLLVFCRGSQTHGRLNESLPDTGCWPPPFMQLNCAVSVFVIAI